MPPRDGAEIARAPPRLVANGPPRRAAVRETVVRPGTGGYAACVTHSCDRDRGSKDRFAG